MHVPALDQIFFQEGKRFESLCPVMHVACSEGSGHLKELAVSRRDIGPQTNWLILTAQRLEAKIRL